jgi:hypothetical protein
MQFKIEPYFLFLFTISFIIFTPIGTVSHEYGHIAVAKYFGHSTTLHYGSMDWERGTLNIELSKFHKEFNFEITNNLPFEKKEAYKSLRKRLNHESLWITIGGPVQTIFVGIFGLFLIFLRKKQRQINGFKLLDWMAIFLSLFWLREVSNLVISIGGGIYFQNGRYFGGDEAHISNLLNLPEGLIPISFGLLGLIISCYIIFKIVPIQKRFTFILSGLIGGISGFIFWMRIIGPIVLP